MRRVFLVVVLLFGVTLTLSGLVSAADWKDRAVDAAVTKVQMLNGNWQLEWRKDVQADAVIDKTTAHEGQASLKITDASPKGHELYLSIVQYDIPVKPNTTYTLTLWTKADEAGFVRLLVGGGWGFWRLSEIPTAPHGETVSHDWQQLTYEVKTKPDDTLFQLRLHASNVSRALWVDSITLVEEGSSQNLIKGGSFEE